MGRKRKRVNTSGIIPETKSDDTDTKIYNNTIKLENEDTKPVIEQSTDEQVVDIDESTQSAKTNKVIKKGSLKTKTKNPFKNYGPQRELNRNNIRR